jgi:hypothetical protein
MIFVQIKTDSVTSVHCEFDKQLNISCRKFTLLVFIFSLSFKSYTELNLFHVHHSLHVK